MLNSHIWQNGGKKARCMKSTTLHRIGRSAPNTTSWARLSLPAPTRLKVHRKAQVDRLSLVRHGKLLGQDVRTALNRRRDAQLRLHGYEWMEERRCVAPPSVHIRYRLSERNVIEAQQCLVITPHLSPRISILLRLRINPVNNQV